MKRIAVWALVFGAAVGGGTPDVFGRTESNATEATSRDTRFLEARDATVAAVVRQASSRLARVRVLAASAADAIGAAGAPTTGWSLGGGWIITSDYGWPADAEAEPTVVCQLGDETPVAARVAGRDFARRLVLFSLDNATEAPPALPTIRPVRVGETVVVLGSAAETPTRSAATTGDGAVASVGVVSATGRLGGRALQIDAATSPANYGGPVLTLDGEVVGIVAPLSPGEPTAVALYDSGIGFAVPIEDLAARLGRLAAGESILPGRLGLAAESPAPLQSPARLTRVAEDGPAAAAGLRVDDVIVRLGSHPTPTAWSLSAVTFNAGQRVTVRYERGGATFDAELIAAPVPQTGE